MLFSRSHGTPPWLLATNLSTLGHTRRLRRVVPSSDSTQIFEYVFETGFEHRRFRHHWIGAVVTAPHQWARAFVAGAGWARAVGAPVGHHRVPLGPPGGPSILTAHLEDPEQWSGPGAAAVRDWFAAQSPDHVWEIVPGYVIAYVPGVMTEAIGESMATGAQALAAMLVANPPTAPAVAAIPAAATA